MFVEWNQISPRRSSLTQILLLQLHRACQRSRNCFIFRPGPREQCSFPWLHSMEVHCVLIRSSLKQLLRQELKKKVNDTINKPKRVKERLFFFFFSMSWTQMDLGTEVSDSVLGVWLVPFSYASKSGHPWFPRCFCMDGLKLHSTPLFPPSQVRKSRSWGPEDHVWNYKAGRK